MILLKYMAPWLPMIPKRRPPSITFEFLRDINQAEKDPGRESPDRVLHLAADIFAEAHSDDTRTLFYFRSRFWIIENEAVESMFF